MEGVRQLFSHTLLDPTKYTKSKEKTNCDPSTKHMHVRTTTAMAYVGPYGKRVMSSPEYASKDERNAPNRP